jgi:DUF4097 and DUF4098 domain-containing protein YvlB
MRPLALLPAFALVLSGCGLEMADWGDSDRYKEDFHMTKELKSGGRLTVEGFNGSIQVTGWDQNTVDISGTKQASREEVMKSIQIDVTGGGDAVSVRAVKPQEMNCNCGVKYIVKVPRKVILERLASSNGSVRVEGIEGDVTAKTSNGSVTLTGVTGSVNATTSNASVDLDKFSGAAIVKTSNGRIRGQGIKGKFEGTTSNASIDVGIASLDSGAPLRLDSSNGSITATLESWNNNPISVDTSNSSINLRLPDGVNADLRARTSNGSINLDRPVTTSKLSKTSVDGKFGSGGPVIELVTSNGSIRLQNR